jgi:hypothetical protein
MEAMAKATKRTAERPNGEVLEALPVAEADGAALPDPDAARLLDAAAEALDAPEEAADAPEEAAEDAALPVGKATGIGAIIVLPPIVRVVEPEVPRAAAAD